MDAKFVPVREANEEGLPPPLEMERPSSKINQAAAGKTDGKTYRQIAIVLSLAVFSYIGAFVRVGFSYYRIWKSSETNYCLMYSQIIGCLIMGAMVPFKAQMTDPKTSSVMQHALYLGITTGLCGSITSFSSWMYESNKSFFLQWDLSWGNVSSSYNGGRFMEWLVALWVGTVLPLSALKLGKALNGWYGASSWAATPKKHRKTSRESSEVIPLGVDELPVASSSSPVTHTANEQHALAPWRAMAIWVFIFAVATVILIAVPIAGYPSWSFLTYIGLLGAAGTFTRYYLASLNVSSPTFPMGTFLANILGTLLLAIMVLLSRFVVDYSDVSSQAVISGVVQGFCGCLTTVSTYVAELDTLAQMGAPTTTAVPLPVAPATDAATEADTREIKAKPDLKAAPVVVSVSGDYLSYRYAIISNAVAQLLLIFILNIYSYQQVPTQEVTVLPRIHQCTTNAALCSEMLDLIACPPSARNNVACFDDGNDLLSTHDADFIGNCSCGAFPGDRVTELMIDSQVIGNFSNMIYPVWPTHVDDHQHPSEVYDYCLTFQSACEHYLDRVQCPVSDRVVTACSAGDGHVAHDHHQGILHVSSTCLCGGNDVPGDRIQELIADFALQRRYDLLPFASYVTTETVNMCTTFDSLCGHMLEHIQCPVAKQQVIGCTNTSDYTTYVGQCTCGDHYDTSQRIAENIFDNLMKYYVRGLLVPLVNSTWEPTPDVYSGVVLSSSSPGSVAVSPSTGMMRRNVTWDACSSYEAICGRFLDFIGCPTDLRSLASCPGTVVNATMYATLIPQFDGECVCGAMDVLNDRAREVMIDQLLAYRLAMQYTYLAPPVAPYTAVASSLPYKQLQYQNSARMYTPYN